LVDQTYKLEESEYESLQTPSNFLPEGIKMKIVGNIGVNTKAVLLEWGLQNQNVTAWAGFIVLWY
jgi:hypothetical protein